jgi:type III restriction enzyme
VLWHVGAQALQREEMIKLPIVLMEHPTGWKDAVRDAILTRDRLETLALKEPDYIRPVLLFQAEAKWRGDGRGLLAHLTSADGEKLDRRQIAMATGEQKELDGIVLADPGCPIRYVITVEALKEGWDCPFAYVLCSLQDAKSAKDVEQLLGRVLRMPYARARATPELNKAYAHIVAQGFARVADSLADRLVNNMGFEAYEAALAIAAQSALPLPDGRPIPPRAVEAVIPLPVLPAGRKCPKTWRPARDSANRERGNGHRAWRTDRGRGFPAHEPASRQAAAGVREAIERERTRQAAMLAPSARGVPFAPLPQLCLQWDGELQPVERRLLAELGEFDLFAEPLNLAGFALTETVPRVRDRRGWRPVVTTSAERPTAPRRGAGARQRERSGALARPGMPPARHGQARCFKWLLALLRHLIADRGFTLTALVRAKYPWPRRYAREIERRRGMAVKSGIPEIAAGIGRGAGLADTASATRSCLPSRPLSGAPPFYSGRYRFQKHYYPVIHDLREKRADGTPAEEFVCARAIDTNPAVKHWVRNVERDERFSFWLPTATDYFYPDFVCELNDGRVLVVEYKGEHLLNDEASEKAQIGHQWETSSGGRCLFLLADAFRQQRIRRQDDCRRALS